MKLVSAASAVDRDRRPHLNNGHVAEQVTEPALRVAGLFAGIGGIERGLHAAGHETVVVCEIDEAARAVLAEQFPNVASEPDVTKMTGLPPVDLVAGGFPCQDLSQAGRTAGIRGTQSGLVGEVFRLLEKAPEVQWLLLENVSFMLRLDRGRAMTHLTDSLSQLGYQWAYRVVDTRAFGLPQRRQRVILLASKEHDPRDVLYADEAGQPEVVAGDGLAHGFYWTEGTRGLGWAIDAVPTLKGGSSLGIPSPPAIWMPGGEIVTPEIRDAERLQGFPKDWTQAALEVTARRGARWKLVGNAVSVPVAEWVGERLRRPGEYDSSNDVELRRGVPWPSAAWGGAGQAFRADRSTFPMQRPYQHLHTFLEFDTAPLSERATRGFLSRARASSLRFADGFLDGVAAHLQRVEAAEIAA